jgi:hypothetical protein
MATPTFVAATGDPFVATGASQANAAISTANSTIAIPSMTPGNGDLVLLIGGAFNADTSTPLTFSGYTGSPTPTERIDSTVAVPGVQEVSEFVATFTSDGTATGARTATTNNVAATSTLSVGMAYALRGASAATARAVTFGPRRTQARRIGPQSFVEQRTYSPPPVVVVPGQQNNQSLPFFGVGS